MNQQRFRVHSSIESNFGASDLLPKEIWFMAFKTDDGKYPKQLKVSLRGHFYFGVNIDFEIILFHEYEKEYEKISIAKEGFSVLRKLPIGIYKFYIKNTSLKESQDLEFEVKSDAFSTDRTNLKSQEDAFVSPQIVVFSDYVRFF
jgi:hypothetical protein